MSGSGREQASSAIWVAVGQIELPEKKYFKIGEVAHLVGVEPHVLRYWQTQFPQVRPHKSRSGHRLYRRKDVETLLAVKELLHVQRFTIAGARQALKNAVVHRGDTSIPPVEISDTDLPRYAAEGVDTAFDDDGEAENAPERQEPEELAEIEVVALAPEELAEALEEELASRQEPTARVEVDVEVAPAVTPALVEPTAEPAPAPAPPVPANGSGDRGRDVVGRMEFALVATSAEGREALLDAKRELMGLIALLDSASSSSRAGGADGRARRLP